MATRWCGYLSGAVQSGHRAAASVLKELNKEKLGQDEKDILKEFKAHDINYKEIKRKSYDKKCLIL